LNDFVAGVASVLPAQSVAATLNLYEPFFKATGGCHGDMQAVHRPVSMRHLNGPMSERSERVNLKVGRVNFVNVGDVVIKVLGATVSTVNDLDPATAVRLPSESTARTLKMCWPWLRLL
jgi:hypothetical protein